jgi:hypothetical protein
LTGGLEDLALVVLVAEPEQHAVALEGAAVLGAVAQHPDVAGGGEQARSRWR